MNLSENITGENIEQVIQDSDLTPFLDTIRSVLKEGQFTEEHDDALSKMTKSQRDIVANIIAASHTESFIEKISGGRYPRTRW